MNQGNGSSKIGGSSNRCYPHIGSLCNLGNTCFLNSVLYTLRFTPGFSHFIHHLSSELELEFKSSNDVTHDVIFQLHKLFQNLTSADESPESKESSFPPTNFLNAVGRLNPIFEGNHQQDAHELLVTILNTLIDIKVPSHVVTTTSSLSSQYSEKNNESQSQKIERQTKKDSGLPSFPAPLPNFIKENFVGKSIMSTKCLECEMSTYRSETFANIDIPLHFSLQGTTENDEDRMTEKELFIRQIMASETLRENNKYWCEVCSRYNEARRNVRFELLPQVLVLQLKRFTTTSTTIKSSYMSSKINDYIPTPFTMNCFCNQCYELEKPIHVYKLYAVIMHLSASLACGHYIAYVRSLLHYKTYESCSRVPSSPPSSSSLERKNISNKKRLLRYFSRSAMPVAKNSIIHSSSSYSCIGASCCGPKTLRGDEEKSFGSENDFWLECDDENIAVISGKQFKDILSSKQGSTTPYLLFYQKM